MQRFLSLLAILGVLFGGASGWSQQAPQWQQVAVLSADVSTGETLVRVDWSVPGMAGYAVLVESGDDSLREIGVIGDVHPNHIVLKRSLLNNFKAGSRIYQ